MTTDAGIADAIAYNQRHASDVLDLAAQYAGYDTEPEDYSAEIVKRVMELQHEYMLEADGKIGERTLAVLGHAVRCRETAELVPTAGATTEERQKHWRQLALTAGHDLSDGRAALVAVRGMTRGAARTHVTRSVRAYDDSFVLLGGLHDEPDVVVEFDGATHPYQTQSKHSPNQDGRGDNDVAMIRPGHYRLEPVSKYHGQRALSVRRLDGNGWIPCYNDLNQDGTISLSEMERAVSAVGWVQSAYGIGAYATDILFHPGYDTHYVRDGKQVRFSSIGCQTASPSFIEQVYARAPIDYVLIDANALPR